MSTLNKNGAGDWLLDATTVSTSNLGISSTDTSGVSFQTNSNQITLQTAGTFLDKNIIAPESEVNYINEITLNNNKQIRINSPIISFNWAVDSNGNVVIS